MAKVQFTTPAPVQVLNFGDIVKVARDGGTRAYMVAVAPCTQKGKAILVNMETGDIRGRGKKYICNVQNYAFDIGTTSLDDLKGFAKADTIELLTGASVTIG